MKRLLLIAVLITSSAATAADKEVVLGALGFMMGGDNGWSAVSDNYKADGCKVTYVQSVMGIKSQTKQFY